MHRFKHKILRSNTDKVRPTLKEYGEPYVNFANMQIGVMAQNGSPVDFLGVTKFSQKSSYVAKALVTFDGDIYRAQKDIGPGPFNPDDWESFAPSDPLPDLASMHLAAGFAVASAGPNGITIGSGGLAGEHNEVFVLDQAITKTLTAFVEGNGGGVVGGTENSKWVGIWVIKDTSRNICDVMISSNVTDITKMTPAMLPAGFAVSALIAVLHINSHGEFTPFTCTTYGGTCRVRFVREPLVLQTPPKAPGMSYDVKCEFSSIFPATDRITEIGMTVDTGVAGPTYGNCIGTLRIPNTGDILHRYIYWSEASYRSETPVRRVQYKPGYEVWCSYEEFVNSEVKRHMVVAVYFQEFILMRG